MGAGVAFHLAASLLLLLFATQPANLLAPCSYYPSFHPLHNNRRRAETLAQEKGDLEVDLLVARQERRADHANHGAALATLQRQLYAAGRAQHAAEQQATDLRAALEAAAGTSAGEQASLRERLEQQEGELALLRAQVAQQQEELAQGSEVGALGAELSG